MKQWDTFLFPFDVERPHPVVILSSEERCLNPDLKAVNGILCTSAETNRGPRITEIILDETDGLAWKTAVKCDFIHALEKAKFREQRGIVSLERRREIARKIAFCLRLPIH